MISSPAAAPSLPLLRQPRWLLAIMLTALGDWLFYGHVVGVSLALFALALAAAVPVANPVRRDRRVPVALALLLLGILPLLESVSALSVLFGAIGLALFTVVMTGGLAPGWPATTLAAGRTLIAGPVQIVPDLIAQAGRTFGGAGRFRVGAVVGWVLPLGLCGLFAALFASANPLLDAWLTAVSWSALKPKIGLDRVAVWLVLAALAWPLLAVRSRYPGARTVSQDAAPVANSLAASVGLDAVVIRRCLVLFNLLFAVQTMLDLLFLWGGLALPEGLTYASYAHRGAYPLIVTALLAAVFVLVTMGPGGAGARSGMIRGLVYLWTAQNVLLVVSAMLRLDLYVSVYSLTYIRAAAFVWMGLVAAGLILIVLRIALRRSNAWLIAANLGVLAAVLYACAFVNVPAVVSGYNVAHSRELGGDGGPFDVHYAMSLGPQAIPAIDRYRAAVVPPYTDAARWRQRAAEEHGLSAGDWRGWSFRDQRLTRYLASDAIPPAMVPNPPETR